MEAKKIQTKGLPEEAVFKSRGDPGAAPTEVRSSRSVRSCVRREPS